MIEKPLDKTYFPSFCGGSIYHECVGTSLDDVEDIAKNAIYRMVATNETSMVMADCRREGYTCVWTLMDWLKEREGTILHIPDVKDMGNTRNPKTQFYAYLKGTLEVKIEEVLITKPWINLNSRNTVRMCIVVFSYNKNNLLDAVYI